MFQIARRLSRCLCLLSLLWLTLPLRAQLDPNLMGSKTDFLDLYQQSGSAVVKPELLTVFDFSSSMASLMFHPLFPNQDVGDQDDMRYISFALQAAGTGTTNTYTITAQGTAKTGGCSCYAYYSVAVDALGNATGTSGTNNSNTCGGTGASGAPTSYTLQATAAGQSGAYDQVTMTPVKTANSSASNSTPYNISVLANSGVIAGSGLQNSYQIQNITYSPAQPAGGYTPGTVVTLTATLNHILQETGEPSTDDGINWSGGGTSGSLAAGSTNGVYTKTLTFTIPTYTYVAASSGSNTVQLNPISVSGTMTAGKTLTFNDTFLTAGTDTEITWSVTLSNLCGSALGINGKTTSVTVAPGTAVTWVIPTCATTTTNPWVKVTLDASQGVSYKLTGLTYANTAGNPLTAGSNSNAPVTGLVRPDGSMLTTNNFSTYGGSLSINGFGKGKADVRNWIRQASHVRFQATVNGNVRTIDVPIPWNIGANGSTTNPVADQTVTDQETTTTPPTGTGNAIPMDTCYLIDDSKSSVKTGSTPYQTGGVFTTTSFGAIGSTSTATSVTLASVAYRPTYISWLFSGTFGSSSTGLNYTSDSSMQGKYIVFDAVSTALAYGQTSATWGQAFGPSGTTWTTGTYYIPSYNLDGTYASETAGDPSSNAIPALTRAQAVKRAAIQTWIKHQADIYWAFRFLDPEIEATNGTNSSIDNNSSKNLVNSDTTTPHLIGNDSKWTLLNGNSAAGMARIASMFPYGETPLTYAMARSLAQFTDPTSVFNSVETGAVSQCQNSFLILFTDGADNNGNNTVPNPNTASPYLDPTTGNFDALTGNHNILTNPLSRIDTTGINWNLFTYAGIGAHLGDTGLGTTAGTDYLNALNPGSTPSTGALPETFLPYSMYQRAGTTFSKPHRVTTMTVGVSLGGLYSNPKSPKYNLFLAALVGDPGTNSENLNSVHPFVPPVYNADGSVKTENDWVPKTDDPTSYPKYGQKGPNAIYYFDGTDPTKLSQCLDVALLAVISAGGTNATSVPNLPYVGASLGQETFLGKFQIPSIGGILWNGDLLCFDTKEVQVTNTTTGAISSVIELLDNTGAVATTVDSTTAMWSASTNLQNNRLWSARALFTRIPYSTDTTLATFSDQGTAYTDTTKGLMNFVGRDGKLLSLLSGTAPYAPLTTADQQTQQQVIQNAAGAYVSGVALGTRPTTNRSNMMGDIIDSNPATLEYNFTDSNISSGISAHNLALSGGNRFRLILVGTNQGWLHAFGEVSGIGIDSKHPNIPVSTVEDELWAFMPTDFLKFLGTAYGANANSGSPIHHFMVDGTPSIYFLDLPPTTGGSANGVLDNASPSKERAIAIIGLGKGGRSYYALNIKDPFNPSLQWSLVPDEAASFPSSRNKTVSPHMADADLQTLIGNMGFSTCTPGFGRVLFNNVLTDVVFLGGGLSVPEIESNFKVNGGTPMMGRSVLALDVNTGNVLAAYTLPNGSDLGASTGPGPVVAGVVPFEFILNSGMAQRAYFTDRSGGLWSWGSKQTVTSTSVSLPNYRIDSSDLANWTVDGAVGSAAGIRKVYQDGNKLGAIYTTLPAPFKVGSFPGVAKDGQSPVAAVGIAMTSGDRYNPVEGTYYLGYPDHFRLSVVFDRQDSRAWSLDSQTGPDTGILDSNMTDFTNSVVSANPPNYCTDTVWQKITPGCSSYYLNPTTGTPSFGYYVNFPVDPYKNGLGQNFLNKGITSPYVVSGALIYSYWSPSTYDPCAGATGSTYTNLIASVLNPIVTDSRTGLAVQSGLLYTWTGLASALQGFGTRGVLQGGIVTVSGGSGSSDTTLLLKTFEASPAQNHPKARVWRTVTN